jgi:spore coat polysaccharide biosynthesis predicted glycosyltransferase SpsG/RimJ/RimL family protein N-acetyltransferase
MRLLLRCDGGPGVGVGHVVRCLALAEEAVGRGHEVSLLGRLDSDVLRDLAAAVGPGLRLLGPDDGSGLERHALDHEVVHVDHYELPALVLDGLAAAAARAGAPRPVLSVLADGRWGARPADVLVDPSAGAELTPPLAPARWHLRGTRFVALRRAVRAPEPAPRLSDRLQVLVVMGGTDPLGCAPLVVDALDRTRVPMDVTVITTPATRDRVAEQAATWTHGVVRVLPPVPDLPRFMARSDVVVTAAGTSTWELCSLGRAMAAVAVVENQRAGYEVLLSAGAATGLGTPADLVNVEATAEVLRPLLTDSDHRALRSRRALGLVDGQGAWRVVRMLEEAVTAGPARGPAPPVAVRRARLEDADLLRAWRNDPTTRAVSRSAGEVGQQEHLSWLRSSLERPDRLLLVGLRGDQPVGTVRWDAESGRAWEVSIAVAPQARGQGVASALLAAGEVALWEQLSEPAEALLAVVHRDNAPSRRLFVASGYAPDLPADAEGFERWVKTVRPGPR